ncbi:MAG TPA: S41 family peptidase [Pyrinomonadaceae bacterium]|nr:S41 family peptidase [Pyrinomonadaceae bacterium]
MRQTVRLSHAFLATLLAASVTVLATRGPNTRQTVDATKLSGTWDVSLHETDGVEIEFRMTFKVANAAPLRWEAYSRAGAAREMVSGSVAFLGRLSGKMPPHEALIYIGDGTAEERGDVLTLKGSLESPFLGKRDFNGTLVNQVIHADLTRASSTTKAGTMEFVRSDSTQPLRDYAAIAVRLEQAIRSTLFDPALVENRDFAKFFVELKQRFGAARDDLDAIAAFQALKGTLRISHLDLIRNPRLASRSLEEVIAGDKESNPDTFVRFGFPAPGVAVLRVTKWDRVDAAIDQAFERIDKAQSRVLLFDIRGNPGGDATSMAPLAHLVNRPVTIGTFLGRKWYATHRAAPTADELFNLRSIGSDTNPSLLFSELRDHGALVAKVLPRAPYFAGAVYLLVDHVTASASEPLAHALLRAGRATLIGERTSGSMLLALPHSIGDGWIVTIPEADFVAADGLRLEGKGVEPNLKCAPGDVYLTAAEQFAAMLPFSAALVRGQSFESLKQAAEAEKSYRAALRVANQQNPAPTTKSIALVHKRLAVILKAKDDQAGALAEYKEVLKLVPDDAEALAAVRANK